MDPRVKPGSNPRVTSKRRINLTGIRSSLTRMGNLENSFMFRQSAKENAPALRSGNYRIETRGTVENAQA